MPPCHQVEETNVLFIQPTELFWTTYRNKSKNSIVLDVKSEGNIIYH